ncbi:glycosyltransferase family 4 protein [Pseudoluteimonas lycopersici]|uniref:Glycosyltransferase family 4 protein n=1 Tax=Pseudoluteimonas lycopersici TaxID=1324796 RepID=A0A516V883_9GAMM|nr:glycosyltransferase family 4 protein [Lysobacter lycopersici]
MAAWCLLHVAIGVAGTWLARRYALRRQLIDQPGDRRSHAVATPRGGGIAIVASALLAFGWLASTHAMPGTEVAMLATGLVLVAGIGWLDDHRPLSPWLRLGVHAVSAFMVGFSIWQQGHSLEAAVLGFGLTVVLINVWNFMDGIDGLATSQALLVAAGWAWLAWPDPWAWVLFAVAAACLGFLPSNLPPARIFLGDVGSGALGYLLAVGLLWLPAGTPRWTWLAWLPLSAFLVDAALTLLVRILRGERWWAPHLQHAYQRWVARSGRHGPVSLAYALWTACAVATMVLARGAGTGVGAAALGIGYAAAAMIWAWLRWNRTTQEGSGQA